MSDGSRVNVLHWELSEVVTVSEGLMVNLLDKVDYHRLTFFKEKCYRRLASLC